MRGKWKSAWGMVRSIRATRSDDGDFRGMMRQQVSTLTQWSMQCHKSKAYPSQCPAPFAWTLSTQAWYFATKSSQW